MNGKLTGAILEYAPRTITKGDTYYNPYPEEMQLADGWKPIIETPAPPEEEGYYWTAHWEQDEETIFRVWEKHETEPTEEDRIAELEKAMSILLGGVIE